MNILVIGKFYEEGFGLHIAETLAELGHSVKRFEPGIGKNFIGGRFGHRLDQVRGVIHSSLDGFPAMRAVHMRKLWACIDAVSIDVVIVCHDFLWPNEVKELKKRTGAKVALWFPDAMVNFGRAFFMTAPYDGLFFKDPFIPYCLDGVLRSPVYYLPECFNPSKHTVVDIGLEADKSYACDITTAGSQHSWRVAFFSHMKEFKVKMWGNPPPLWMSSEKIAHMYQGRSVYYSEKTHAFRSAKIVLNNLHYGEVWGVNARCFEAAGAGAFQLVNWRPAIDHLFKDGEELITFRGVEDLKDKVRYWLPRDDERRSIGDAAKRRAFSEHTYKHRLELLLETLSGKANGFESPRISYSF